MDRPVLILVDEIMDYIRQLSDSPHHDLAIKDMAFLRALLDSVNDVPHVAMVVVMIASDKDTMALDDDGPGPADRAGLSCWSATASPPPSTTTPTSLASCAVAFRVGAAGRGGWRHCEAFQALDDRRLEDESLRCRSVHPGCGSGMSEVARCYPFHPQLIRLAEQEWAKLAGFQRVRSTIRIFAATVFTLAKRAEHDEWAPLLIGPGDLPFPMTAVREAIIGSGSYQRHAEPKPTTGASRRPTSSAATTRLDRPASWIVTAGGTITLT